MPSKRSQKNIIIPNKNPLSQRQVIHVSVEAEFQDHAHFVFCVFEKSADNVFSMKVLKQKQNIDGVSFILQEIYGMESKGSSDKSVGRCD